MRDDHVEVDGSSVRFEFRGKSGKEHSVGIRDRRLARIIKRCLEVPGQELFQYLDDAGERQSIGSGDVNDYLREITGQEFTAKDFRTWAGTVIAAAALSAAGPGETAGETRSNILRTYETVAQRLGNTPAIARKCYVHPVIIESYLMGETIDAAAVPPDPDALSLDDLRREEQAVLGMLREAV
jgi:DNA topoisomerase-1